MKNKNQKKFADLFNISDAKEVKIDKAQLDVIIGGNKKEKDEGDDEPITLVNSNLNFNLDVNPITS